MRHDPGGERVKGSYIWLTLVQKGELETGVVLGTGMGQLSGWGGVQIFKRNTVHIFIYVYIYTHVYIVALCV